MEVFSIEYALLAMQNALLREVTPELRAVIVDLNKDHWILHVCFYYDGEASEKMIDLWQCAATEASAHLGPNCFVKLQIERLDYPQKIPSHGYYAYLRKECNSSNTKDDLRKRVKISEMSMAYALLAVQSALLGVVTPELRAAVVDCDKEMPSLYIRLYYDGEVPEELITLWQCAITEAGTNFAPNCLLDGKVERVDYPKTFFFRGRYAYFRKE